METDKKRRELAYLNSFLKENSLNFIVNNIEPSETPDFILHTSIGKISVEITQLIDEDLRIIETFRNAIINKAHERFTETYPDNLYCLITLRNVTIGQRVERQKLIEKYSQKLFERIEALYLDRDPDEFDVTISDINEYDDIVMRVHVKSSPDFDHWQHFGAHRVDTIDINWLNKRILQKEEKIKNYREVYVKNWLLMISNLGTKPSAHGFDFLDFSQLHSHFDKIYIFKYMGDKTILVIDK